MTKVWERQTEGRLPTFLGIGVPRSGTTWLYRCLKQHPQVYMPSIKEVQYFVVDGFRSKIDRGLDWYTNLYNFSEKKGYICWGEISPRYYYYPGTPVEIARIIPGIKLIYSLRNPVEMLYSLYMYHMKMFPYTINAMRYGFQDFLDHHMVATLGFYFKYLKRYLEYFPREQIHILLYDDLKTDPENYFYSVCSFLGIDSDLSVPVVKTQINQAVLPRNFRRAIFLQYLYFKTGLNLFNNIDQKYNRISYKDWGQRTAISRKIFNRLITIYRDDISDMSCELGRDLSSWTDFDKLDPAIRKT